MKKKILIILGIILVLIVIASVGLVVFYKTNLEAVDNNLKEVTDQDVVLFVVNSGDSTKTIIDNLEKAGLIKNKYAAYAYLKLHHASLQAGTYELNKGMSFSDIIDKMAAGDIANNTVTVTFIEGKRLVNYVKIISSNFGYSEEEILTKMNDKEYLKGLIDEYWFLTDDILNDKLYYALEGYLAPDTYIFYNDASIEEIIKRLLDETSSKLEPYKEEIEKSKYSIHEMLTLASIVELEGNNSNDRAGVAGVFYNRLKAGMSLGSDVTTYYGAKVELSERELYQKEIDEANAYNTRHPSMIGKLPVGPICNPSTDSLVAAIEPEEHDYLFFVADKNKETYFTKTNAEHEAKIAELKRNGLWYDY